MTESAEKPSTKQRLLVLDAARFFAALIVVFYHYKTNYLEYAHISQSASYWIYSIAKFGYLGVDLFFMISGFVILASAMNRSAIGFAISRMTRIYPTFWVCMTITAIVLWLTPQDLFPVSLTQYLVNLTLFEGYFGISHIDGVFWTLEVEIKFYFLMFAIILFGLLNHHKIWLPLWLASSAVFIITENLLNQGQPFFMGWFISPHYSPYFIAGIIFYLGYHNHKFEKAQLLMLVVSYFLSAIYGYQVIETFARDVTQFDRIIACIIILGIYTFFYFIAARKLTLSRLNWLVTLGGLTYPLYLLHSAIGKVLFETYGSKENPLLSLAIITSLVLIASLIIHLWIERRLADRLKRFLLNVAAKLNLAT